jgi:hypothetical protein
MDARKDTDSPSVFWAVFWVVFWVDIFEANAELSTMVVFTVCNED